MFLYHLRESKWLKAYKYLFLLILYNKYDSYREIFIIYSLNFVTIF